MYTGLTSAITATMTTCSSKVFRMPAELAREANDEGCWTGSEYHLDLTRTRCSAYDTDCWVVTASSVDQFPFVGSVPNREGHWMAAGFVGHGKHRYLCSLSCSYTHDLRYATDPSLDSLHCSRCAELIRLRIQAAGPRRSVPSAAEAIPRDSRESGQTTEYRSRCKSSSIPRELHGKQFEAIL